MGAINCKTYDTGEIVDKIRENRRYAIASPSTVTGAPSLAMQSAAQMAVVYIYVDDVKISTPLTISGTTKTPIMINGASPSRGDLLTLSFEVTGIGSGEVLITTDEPNGSPSSPFASEAERAAWATANLATLRSGVSTVWGPGGEWSFVGPEADKWSPVTPPVDLIVYGATLHGISAAIAAKRAGLSVIVLNPDTHIGGMVTGGIAATDYVATRPWTADIIPGIAGEFLRRIGLKQYPQDSTYIVAKNIGYWIPLCASREVLGEMIEEAGIEIVNDAYLLSATVVDESFSGVATRRITQVTTTKGAFTCLAGAHDGTDEGDLLAAAGVTFVTGREAAATYSETGAGITPVQTFAGIDPYVTPGNPASGLLFGFESEGAAGSVGDADPRAQAIQFRLSFTATDPHHQIEPSNYDPLQFEYFGRKAVASGAGWTTIGDVLTLYPLPNTNIVDINQKTEFSIGWVGPEATEWITATKSRRDEIREIVKQWTLGFLKFLKTDTRIPVAVRDSVASYGFTDADFHENNGFPTFIYCREGRRLLGDFVLTANDIITDNTYTDPAAFAYYAMDSHNVRRYVSGGVPTVEGAVFNETTVVGARVPMRVCLPKAVDCCNLTASAAISCSRMAYLSLRMEPVRAAIAEFAGVIQAVAHRKNKPVQSVTWAEAVPLTGMGKCYPQKPGDILMFADRTRPYTPSGVTELGGAWTLSAKPLYGQISKHYSSLTIGSSLRFFPTVRVPGAYRVKVQFPVVPTAINATRATAVPVTIVHAGGTTTLTLNQSGVNACYGGAWADLGTYVFRKGSTVNTGTGTDLSPDYVDFGTDGSGTKSTWITAVAFEKVD